MIRGDSAEHLRGIVHCHTEMSYDGSISLEVLCRTLKDEGFSFVAVTDHVKGITAEQYIRFVDKCKDISSDAFLVIPGLEILFDNGDEIAAVGIHEFICATSPNDVIKQVKQQGGYAIWAHPYKRRCSDLTLYDCDAIEILNGKEDGTVAPNLRLTYQTRLLQRKGKKLHQIFGADLHHLQEARVVWIECGVESNSETHILKSLREGNYINHASRVALPAVGRFSVVEILEIVLFKLAYCSWNLFLRALPNSLRNHAIRYSRKIVCLIKSNL